MEKEEEEEGWRELEGESFSDKVGEFNLRKRDPR